MENTKEESSKYVNKKQSVSQKQYDKVHQWLRYHHGPAKGCENPKCLGKSKYFTWALKRDKNYEKNIKNFFQFCRVCHANYDVTEHTRKIMRELCKYTNRTHCSRGHSFDKENTYVYAPKDKPSVVRKCRTCMTANRKKYEARLALEDIKEIVK